MICMPDPTQNATVCDQTRAVTRLLDAVRAGEPAAHDRLIELVYGELHQMARRQLAREKGGITLQPTALVNEAWMRLFGAAVRKPAAPDVEAPDNNAEAQRIETFENRRHFFAAAAEAMRRICVDDARRRTSVKRGGGVGAVELAEAPAAPERDPLQVLAVNDALAQLASIDKELAEIVRLRYFMNLGLEDTAGVLGMSRRKVAYRWRMARAWLHRELTSDA